MDCFFNEQDVERFHERERERVYGANGFSPYPNHISGNNTPHRMDCEVTQDSVANAVTVSVKEKEVGV